MDSPIWPLALLLTTTLLFLLCLLLISRNSRRSQQELANRLTTMQAASLRLSFESTEMILETVTKLAEDSRSQTVALTQASRTMATEHLEATNRLAEQLQAAARESAFRQATELARYERLIAGPHASLTSMLTTTIRLLGTKDAIAYRSVAGADLPTDQATQPYTTGDELETERMQASVDEMFASWQGGVTDEPDGDRSAFADFGIPGV